MKTYRTQTLNDFVSSGFTCGMLIIGMHNVENILDQSFTDTPFALQIILQPPKPDPMLQDHPTIHPRSGLGTESTSIRLTDRYSYRQLLF